MEAYVKFQSQESTFNLQAAATGTARFNNLASFSLPSQSGAYDLSESYVSVHIADVVDIPASANADANPVLDLAIDFKENLGASTRTGNPPVFLSPVVSTPAVLVKNAVMRTDKGQVESIRNVACLRANMAYYEKTEKQYQKQLGSLANTPYPYVSSRQQVNPLNNRGLFASEQRVHEIQIPLKDIYNVGSQSSWSTDYYGQTDINLELNLDLLLGRDAQANRNVFAANIPAPSAGGLKYGDMLDIINNTAADTTSGQGDRPFISKNKYENPEEIPFFVGQRVLATATIKAGSPAGGTAPTAVIAQIAEVRHLDATAAFYGNVAGTLTGQVAVFLEGNGVGVMKTGANSIFENVALGHQAATSIGLQVNKVELVAKKTQVNVQSPLQYTSYMVQEDTVASATQINRTYNLPPNTLNCVILFPNPVFSSEPLSSYRIIVNGDNLSTRDIVYKTGLHYDLLSRYMANRGKVLRNVKEIIEVATNNPTEGGAANANLVMIAFPCPVSPNSSILNIELEGSAALSGKINIYSEVAKQL